MKIAVLKEAAGETRCAAIPETVKKFAAQGATVAVEKGAGESASIADSAFEEAGAVVGSRSDALKGASAILCVNAPDPATIGGAE
ncbi:MAG TPA: NAD(P)(+) transhydrogenase (Re/Si-specific) subunit alpha, partial [Sphingomicrobium sp.]|nr:NAD(P)(+) transhydrogenase (Re/Si-specific) subunit alpha [Sphingomicrobium sp.]